MCYDQTYTTYLPIPLVVLVNESGQQGIYIAPEAFNITQSRDSWASINQVLGGEVFGRLQKADIKLDWYIEQSLPKDEVTHLQASIEEGLKNLEWYKRGILSITHNQQSWKIRS